MNNLSKSVLVALGLVTLASCGGGGDGVASGGTGGTGITNGVSQGPITGFGSVFVNGVKFEDTAATVEIEDATSGRNALKAGMVVKVAWSRDVNGVYTATNINYGDDVQGPVAGITGTAGDFTFTVLGQTVMTHATTTTFDGVAATALVDGNLVEVSGLKDGAGVIHATRIELKTGAGATELEMKGLVATTPAPTATSFTLGSGPGAITVNHNGAAPVSPGACVEVKAAAGSFTGTTFTAATIQLDDDCTAGGVSGNELEIKNYPSDINTAANTFTLNGQAVSYTDTPSVFIGGTEADLSTAVIVEVEGTLSGTVLVAKKISFEREGNLEGKGTAQGSVAADGTFTVNLAEPTVGPKTFTVTNLTTYEDKTDTIANFGKANIAINQPLKVYYYLDGTTNVATRIRLE